MPEPDSQRAADAQDPIKHVILLLLENRSFDQMLGCFKGTYAELEGVDPKAPAVNTDNAGNSFFQKETKQQQMELDPQHELEHVLVQLENNNFGFVRDFTTAYPNSSFNDRQQIMGYYPLMFLDALHRLARDFTICDHWFSSLPGPTWPNRFFALSGTSSGRVKMPEGFSHPDLADLIFEQHQTTIFDRLNETNRSWHVYFYDFPSSLILTHQRRRSNLARYFDINQFFKDARKDAASFPDFAFVEPKYFGVDQNDDHPPHNVMKGEKLIADVYNAIRSNEGLWKSALLVVLFDEHGGFFDHVPPPPAVPPDEHQEEYTFDRLGVRVPAVLVSPWVSKRVEDTQFDHTSLLKYLSNKWNLEPLGARTQNANSIGVAMRESQPRTDTLPFIRVPYSDLIPPKPDLEKLDSTTHHRALEAFSNFLKGELDEVAAKMLEEVARASDWMRVKASIGRQLIRLGSFLTKDLDENNQKRIKVAVQTIVRFLEQR